MQYSFSSAYMAVLASNLLLIMLALCFKNRKTLVNTGYKLLLLFIYCTFLRFLLPFEMPFSCNILMPESLSFLISWVQHPLFIVATYEISIWSLLLAIWAIGFLVNLGIYFSLQEKTKYFILSSCLDMTEAEPYHSTLTQVCKERGKRNCFRVFEVSGITVPMLYGVFSPKILLPENYNISSHNLYFVLAHEVSHHYRRDLVIKNFVHLLCMIYWWNPFCYLLQKQTDIILEMRVDDMITNSDTNTISMYLKCLIEIAEKAHSVQQKSISGILTVSFVQDETDLTKRFEMLMHSGEKRKLSWNIALSILVFGIYILSYVFIFEAHYMSPEYKVDTIEITEDNTYAIANPDGTYDIYFNDLFIETTDSLDYYPEIEIYTQEKENNNEKD